MNKLLNNQLLTSLSEPYIAHVKTDEISDLNDCMINIYIGNDYGFKEETIEIPALSTGVDVVYTDKAISENKQISVYNTSGSLVYTGSKAGFNQNYLVPGIYIERTNDNSLTHKFVVR